MAFAIYNLKLSKADISIIDELSEIPDITQIQRTSGKFDYWIIAMLRDLDHLLDIQFKIRAIQGIDKMEGTIIPQLPSWPTFREFKSTE